MKKMLLVAVSAFALTFAGNVYAHGLDVDADLLTGNGNDKNDGSVTGNDNDYNDVKGNNNTGDDGVAGQDNDGNDIANGNSVDDGSAGQAGNDNDYNTNVVVDVDDIDIHVKVDASKRIAKSDAEMKGVVAGTIVNNGNLGISYAGGNIGQVSVIKTGSVSQTGGFESGISVQQAATGINNLNQAQVQVSAQASFNSSGSD